MFKIMQKNSTQNQSRFKKRIYQLFKVNKFWPIFNLANSHFFLIENGVKLYNLKLVNYAK